jgi:hypothetical protein
MTIRELVRQVNIHCHLNKVRRHVQLANGLNPGLWPLYLASANQLTFEENGFENEQGRAQIIYDFLQHEPTCTTRASQFCNCCLLEEDLETLLYVQLEKAPPAYY